MFSLSKIISNKSGFTLIELIVGMVIFSIGMTAVLALLHSTIENSLYSRHEIVAAGLLWEQVELVRNIRNSNVRSFIPFDSVIIDWSTATGFASGVYLIENNFDNEVIKISQTTGNIEELPTTLSLISLWSTYEERFDAARLYLDAQWRYTHTATDTGTLYASYIAISPLGYRDTWWSLVEVKKDDKNQWYILDARVIVKSRGYKEYDLKTIITDWKK